MCPVANRQIWKTGVYQIKNKINNKVYVGSAARKGGILPRWQEHKRDLRSGKHHNKHLQNAWSLYGEESFEFSILIKCPPESCIVNEQRLVDELKACDRDFGYNLRPSAESNLGIELFDETRERMSLWQIGRKLSDEHKANIGNANRGRVLSADTREKMAAAHRGKKRSIEAIEKTARANRGRKRTDEQRAKMSEAAFARYATGIIEELPAPTVPSTPGDGGQQRQVESTPPSQNSEQRAGSRVEDTEFPHRN